MASVDETDARLQAITNEKNQYINELQSNYDQMSGQAQQKYNELIDASKNYAQQQQDIQQQQTNQTIAEINQNKEKQERDYTKEQQAAYTDYANQTNAYGTNAEKMAAQGLTGSGYQESSRVSMYNAYQNRVAVARQSFNDAIVQYDNQIAQAQIANSSAMAEIAYNALQNQLSLALEGMQYENELLNNLTQQKISTASTYNSQYQSMYNTILSEKQFNEQMAKSSSSSSSRSSSGSSGGTSGVIEDDNSEGNTTLGDSARGLLEELQKSKNTSNNSAQFQSYAVAKVKNAYNGTTSDYSISEKEGMAILDKLGL